MILCFDLTVGYVCGTTDNGSSRADFFIPLAAAQALKAQEIILKMKDQ